MKGPNIFVFLCVLVAGVIFIGQGVSFSQGAGSAEPFTSCDEWGRPKVALDGDGDGFLDTIRVYDYDGSPMSEAQWEIAGPQVRVRIYDGEGGYTEYIDLDKDGIMDKRITVDAEGDKTEEDVRLIAVLDLFYFGYDLYTEFDERDWARSWEHFDKDHNIRERITYDDNYDTTEESWDAEGNPAEPGSWHPVRDWKERVREEFREGTGNEEVSSLYGMPGTGYNWSPADDGVPEPMGLKQAQESQPSSEKAEDSAMGLGPIITCSDTRQGLTVTVHNSSGIPIGSVSRKEVKRGERSENDVELLILAALLAGGYVDEFITIDLMRGGTILPPVTEEEEEGPAGFVEELFKALGAVPTGEPVALGDGATATFNQDGTVTVIGPDGESLTVSEKDFFITLVSPYSAALGMTDMPLGILHKTVFDYEEDPPESLIMLQPLPACTMGEVRHVSDTIFRRFGERRVKAGNFFEPLEANRVVVVEEVYKREAQAKDSFPNDPFYLKSKPNATKRKSGRKKRKGGLFGGGISIGGGGVGISVGTKSRGKSGQKAGAYDQWGLRKVGFKPLSDPDSAWGLGTGKDNPITIAVIDSGIDLTHPDFNHANLWVNKGEIAGNSMDDDRNGYVDDANGWDFLDWDFSLDDKKGHGTFVAGIIAADTDNGEGIAGINQGARIMPLKVMDEYGNTDSFNVFRAVKYAADNGAKVINLSLGGRNLSRLEQKAIDYAYKEGGAHSGGRRESG